MEEEQDRNYESGISAQAIVLGLLCSLGVLALLCLLAMPFYDSSSSEPSPQLQLSAPEEQLDPRLQQLLIDTGATVEESQEDEAEYCESEEYLWHPDDADTQIGGRFSRYGASANAEVSYANMGDVTADAPRGGKVRRRTSLQKPKIEAPTRLRKRRG